ncbi:Cof-type HAD-IIB family hydrolase [Salegentibacter sp. BLCTC]|uniref:Cof-type HAD-IIB family hydrolase n=1 Tax=Salegentibacter sp. BLCTC TaxID=2697368 RepID=UPI00187B5E98|nr:HAD family hydrolase [Salegentibacter sp. BLCTC]MBE7640114.1 Cof-type HAD-IIB family hydrolase [Salegentibacter sp. BLCTC]
MIKLIITDMDGTLLNDQHEIHPDFWEIEELLHKKGVMFSVASGRQFYNLESKFDRIKDRMLFFAENGTHVVHKGKDLYVNSLEKSAALDFIRKGRELPETYLVLCGKKSAYIETKDDSFYNEINKFYKKIEKVEDLTEVDDTILKVTLCNFNGVEEHTYPHFKEHENEYKVAIAAQVFIDITSLTANKGNAISGIQKDLNISPEETLVFGDYLNDLEMMQNAKYSYAMKNAHPEIINASKYITTYSNNENGVLKTIEELGLLKEEYAVKH